jgi:hypothetical protein
LNVESRHGFPPKLAAAIAVGLLLFGPSLLLLAIWKAMRR